MARSPAPIVWDFWKRVNPGATATGLGGLIHYSNTEAQELFLQNGLSEKHATIATGNWQGALWSNVKGLGSASYNSVEFDNPYKNSWYGVGILPGVRDRLYFFKYSYELELGDIVESGSYKMQIDNPIAQVNVELQNVDESIVSEKGSLFQIGAKMELSTCLGDSPEYLLATVYIDSIEYDVFGETLSVSSRNKIGHVLNDETLDEDMSIQGTAGQDFARWALGYFGINDAIIQDTGTLPDVIHYDFKKNASGLSMIQEFEKTFGSAFPAEDYWKMEELPDGRIIVGRDFFRFQYLPRTYYRFHGENEVFSRRISKSIDSVYSRVYCEGTDPDGEALEPEIRVIQNRPTWNIGAHRTFYAPKLENATQEDLVAYAEDYKSLMKDIGVKETFSSPFRPNLLIADVATVYYDGQTYDEDIGIITEVKHTFGKKGFKTEFTLSSGGYRFYENPNVVARVLNVDGKTRRTRMLDFIGKK